ncbi:MAG: helix-turn-helix domain-containing protein [Bullifex sp.]
MDMGNTLARLRKEHGYTQESLAEALGVSRQAVSKWESGQSFPETEKLLKLSGLYGCTLDELLTGKKEEKQEISHEPNVKVSDKMIFGMPLCMVAGDAKAFIAVGKKAEGVIAVGLFARGVVAVGLASIGLISVGVAAIGAVAVACASLGLFSVGCFAAGIITVACIGWGMFSLGAIAYGDFTVGALAVGKYFALGDHASARVAIGGTKATGTLYSAVKDYDIWKVRDALTSITPGYLKWAERIVLSFLK